MIRVCPVTGTVMSARYMTKGEWLSMTSPEGWTDSTEGYLVTAYQEYAGNIINQWYDLVDFGTILRLFNER